MAATLSKEERIYSRNDIQSLLKTGKWETFTCLKICYKVHENSEDDGRMMVSVPKRSFKRAVKRNLLKRRIREAYRLNKDRFKGRDILFCYTAKEVLPFEAIASDIALVK